MEVFALKHNNVQDMSISKYGNVWQETSPIWYASPLSNRSNARQCSVHIWFVQPYCWGRLGVDEVGRRQEEWEKEIESLDQKDHGESSKLFHPFWSLTALTWQEMELHQSQLRLIREQTAIFIRDLAVLQGEAKPDDAAGANCIKSPWDQTPTW